MLKYLVFVGVGVHVCGTFAYLRDTVAGRTKPNRVSWFLWAVVPMIAFAAALTSGAKFAAIPIFMSGFGPVLVFCASFVNKQAYWKITRFDILCGVFSAFALVFWAVTNNPAVAVLFAIIGDLLAGLPTLAKAWKHPKTETGLTFATSLFSAFTGLFAIPVWTFAQFAFPIYLMCMNSALLVSIYGKRIYHKRAR